MGRHFAECAPPILILTRSPQSGSKVMPDAAGTNLTCYEGLDLYPYIFSGGDVDLTNMQAGDTVIIEVHKLLQQIGGVYTLEYATTYNNVQAQPIKHIGAEPNIYGARIRARQTPTMSATFNHSR